MLSRALIRCRNRCDFSCCAHKGFVISDLEKHGEKQDDLNRYAGLNLRRREALHDTKELQEYMEGMQDAVNEIAIMDRNAPDFK